MHEFFAIPTKKTVKVGKIILDIYDFPDETVFYSNCQNKYNYSPFEYLNFKTIFRRLGSVSVLR
jgi:hypothetical protein